MKEIKTNLELDSGIWKINIFEIGNTYQLGAENGEKSIHFMINKRDYLADLLKKKNGEVVVENHSLSCAGREGLTQNEFDQMKNLLFEHMDADLSKEKIQWGIISENKPD